MLFCILPCNVVLGYVMSCWAMPCCDILCYSMLCYVISCHGTLCDIMLCDAEPQNRVEILHALLAAGPLQE